MGYLVLIGSKYLVGNFLNIEFLVGQFLFSFLFFNNYGCGFDVLRVHTDFFFFNLCYLFYNLRGKVSFCFFEDIVGNFFFFFFRGVNLILLLFRLYVYLLNFVCWWVEKRLGYGIEFFMWDFVSANLLDSNLERFDYLMRIYNLPILLDRLSFFFCELWKYEYNSFPVGGFELEVRFLYKLVFPEFFFVCLNDLLIISSEGELSLSGEVNEYVGDEVDVWNENLQHLDLVISGFGGYSVLFLLQRECLQHFIFENVDLSFSWLFFEDEFEYDLGDRETLFNWLGVLAEDEQVILFGNMLLLFDWRNFLLDLWLTGFFSFACSFNGWVSVFVSLMRIFDLMECNRSSAFVCFEESFFFFDILSSVDFNYGLLRGVNLNLNTFFSLYFVNSRV